MLQAVEDISTTKKRLKIEIPSDIIEKEIRDSLEKLRQISNIPGFRLGRAPMNLIEKRFGKKVEAEVLEKVIPEFYREALKEACLMPITLPIFDEKLDFKRQNPLRLSLTVEVMPTIEDLRYSNIKIKDVPISVDETKIEEALNKLQEQKVIYEVADKEIEKDDLVSFEYVDCEIVGTEILPSVKEEISKMGNEILPMDIEEKLLGKRKGEIVELTTTFQEDFRLKELAGKTATIKTKISEVKRKVLPSIDDEFAKDLGSGDLSQLREKIKENISTVQKAQAVKIQKAEILNELIGSHDFEVPETMLKNEIQALMMESKFSQGTASDEKKENDQVPPEIQQRAERKIRALILIRAIGQKEGVTVTDEEINGRISLIAERVSAQPEALLQFYQERGSGSAWEDLKYTIYEDKVLDLLFSHAIIEKGE